ncbi:MAG: hypothetical protein JW860_06030 [Sedimentisphaerales bacterium]|nr:hypothetical protein [Sedimentisphaerales bacterium]
MLARDRLFDWHTFLCKKILKQDIYDVKKIAVAFWVSGDLVQGGVFAIYALCANPWDFPVELIIKPKTTPKAFITHKNQAKKLIMKRDWLIPLAPGQISLVMIPAYATSRCKPFSVSFPAIKINKMGNGKRVFRRRGKSLNSSLGYLLLTLLFLPLGILFFTSSEASIKIPVRKNKTAPQEDPDDFIPEAVQTFPMWSLEDPLRLDLSPLIYAQGLEKNDEYITELTSRCRNAYIDWAIKYDQKQDLEVVII